jgi:hypothetical protein
MSRVKILGAVALTATLFGYALVTLRSSTARHSSERDDTQGHGSARSSTSLDQRARSPDAAANQRVVRQLRMPVSPRPSDTGPPPSTSPDPAVPEEIAQVEAREVQIALDFYTRSHGQQAPDSSWSLEREEQIGDYLANDAFAGNSLETVDCRTTQCRLVVMHQDEQAVQRLHQAWGHGPFRYGGFSHYDEQTRTTTIYLGREGYELQQPELGPPPSEAQ